jgi:hypothetical protein
MLHATVIRHGSDGLKKIVGPRKTASPAKSAIPRLS